MKKTWIILALLTLFVFTDFNFLLYAGERKGGITLEEAIRIAIKEVPGEVIKAELERGVYEIKVRTREGKIEKTYVDAKDGSVIKKKGITLDEAIKIATKDVPGEVVKAEFERGYYEIKIRTRSGSIEKVYVDARSGEVVKRSRRSNDD
ncbi:MAG: PepSY domain-containing protein [Deltaproteobacteria bacterium]|nr:PepSY domain-containing protein [Deltaproteobacteria bacterium]